MLSPWESGTIYRKQRKIEWQYWIRVFINHTFEHTFYAKDSCLPFALHLLLWVYISNWRIKNIKLCVSDGLAQCKFHSVDLRPKVAFVKPCREGGWPWFSQKEWELKWEAQTENSSPTAPQWPQGPESWVPKKCFCRLHGLLKLSWDTALKIKWVQNPSSASFLEGEHLSTVSWIPRACIDLGYLWNDWASFQPGAMTPSALTFSWGREAIEKPPSGPKA